MVSFNVFLEFSFFVLNLILLSVALVMAPFAYLLLFSLWIFLQN